MGSTGWDGVERRQPGKTQEDDERGRYDRYAAAMRAKGEEPDSWEVWFERLLYYEKKTWDAYNALLGFRGVGGVR